MLRRLLSIFAFLALVVPATAVAQTGTITGKVTDAKTGNPLPGVNVALMDINRGAATGGQGNYTIENIPVGTYTLRASFVGYNTFSTEVTIEAGETVTQNIKLKRGAVGLEEVVVTGYGQQKTAGQLTGSISSISAEEVDDVPVQNTAALLQGRAAGVTMAATEGNPGAGFEIDIRGQGSINAGNRPLFIVDGVQMSFSGGAEETSKSPLNAIDPSNIKSIEVLKDAAAAAIYGAQAANGVVIIKTKSGQQGPTQVSLSFEGGVRFQSRRFDMANRSEWAELQKAAFGEDVFRKFILTNFGHPEDAKLSNVPNFNWQDYIFQPGAHRKAKFSASGGDQNTTFYLSGNWSKTGAAVQSAEYQSYGIRTNFTQQLTDALNLSLKMRLSNQRNDGVCDDGFFINCPFYQGISEEPPVSTPYSNDGSYYPFTEEGQTFNPALFLNEVDNLANTTQFVGNVSPTYTLAPWLTVNGNFGVDWQTTQEGEYAPPIHAPGTGGQREIVHNDVTNITANVTLNADHTFGEVHNVNVLLGSEYRREYEERDDTWYGGFNNDLLRAPSAAGQYLFGPQGFNTEYRLLSYFGRLNYNYDNRYIATLTARYDGSSKFGSATRWGFFPSGSVAWRISEESFFDVGFVESLKLRASYGVTGNSQIGNFAARGLFNVGDAYSGDVSLQPSQLANPQLSWEVNRSVNVGLDWSLWEGRVSGSLNLYRTINDELLLNRPLPVSSGYGSITENVGKVLNRGIEFQISTTNVQTENIRWSTRFNVAFKDNEVKQLSPGTEQLNSGAQPIAVGHAIEAWKVPEWAGVNPADGRPMFYDKNGNLTYFPTNEDEKFFDSAMEDAVGGFGTQFSWKGLAVNAFFDFSFGAKAQPATQMSWTDPFGENVLAFVVNKRWKKPGDVTMYPRAVPFGSYPNARSPDYPVATNWLYKANYVRLKNVTVSYSLPPAFADQLGIQDGRIYASGINLWQKSPYLGIDPEVAGTSEASSYPAEQQLNVGVEITL